MTVSEGHLQRGVARNHAESVLGEEEITDDLWPKHAGDIGSGRCATIGCDFFGYAAAPNNVAAFENQRRVSRTRQVRAGG